MSVPWRERIPIIDDKDFFVNFDQIFFCCDEAIEIRRAISFLTSIFLSDTSQFLSMAFTSGALLLSGRQIPSRFAIIRFAYWPMTVRATKASRGPRFARSYSFGFIRIYYFLQSIRFYFSSNWIRARVLLNDRRVFLSAKNK